MGRADRDTRADGRPDALRCARIDRRARGTGQIARVIRLCAKTRPPPPTRARERVERSKERPAINSPRNHGPKLRSARPDRTPRRRMCCRLATKPSRRRPPSSVKCRRYAENVRSKSLSSDAATRHLARRLAPRRIKGRAKRGGAQSTAHAAADVEIGQSKRDEAEKGSPPSAPVERSPVRVLSKPRAIHQHRPRNITSDSLRNKCPTMEPGVDSSGRGSANFLPFPADRWTNLSHYTHAHLTRADDARACTVCVCARPAQEAKASAYRSRASRSRPGARPFTYRRRATGPARLPPLRALVPFAGSAFSGPISRAGESSAHVSPLRVRDHAGRESPARS